MKLYFCSNCRFIIQNGNSLSIVYDENEYCIIFASKFSSTRHGDIVHCTGHVYHAECVLYS